MGEDGGVAGLTAVGEADPHKGADWWVIGGEGGGTGNTGGSREKAPGGEAGQQGWEVGTGGGVRG